MARHKHADVIHAWAEGEEIEWRRLDSDYPAEREWNPFNRDRASWYEGFEYRIKPKRVKKEGWINLYKADGYESFSYAAHVRESKEKADSANIYGRVACIRIEWEEEE